MRRISPGIETHGKERLDANETIGFRGEQREYGIGAQILAALNIHSMRILSNHPRKLVALEAYGLQILTQVPFTYVKRLGNGAKIGAREISKSDESDFEISLLLNQSKIGQLASHLPRLSRCIPWN